MDLKEIGWKGMNWITLAQDRDCCEQDNEPSAPTEIQGHSRLADEPLPVQKSSVP